MKRYLFFAVVCVFISPCVRAQELHENVSWSLEKCIDYAVEHNISVQQSEISVKQKEIALNTAKNKRLPGVSGSTSQNFSFGRGLTDDNTYSNTNTSNTSFNLGADVTLFAGMRISNNIQLSQLNLQSAVANLEKAKDYIREYEELSYAKLHAISPFDNSVVLVDVKGHEFLNIVGDENPQFKAGLSWLNFDENATYTLATNDYMFGAIELLRNKEDAVFTQVSVLDLFVETVTNQSEVYERWSIHLPLMFNTPNLTFTYLIPELHRLYL